MQTTVSEKIARTFEIAGCLWLVPALISLIAPTLFSIAFVLGGNPLDAFFAAIPFLMFCAGLFLLVLYYRHSRGRLGEGKIIPLWTATFFFNLLFFLSSVYIFFSLPETPRPYSGGHRFFIFFFGLAILWQAAAVLLSVTALISEVKNQKYL
ncbi:MAG TPA: hypothetical protein VK400_19845 [Pyrinomonadaceae bacterium]|nr:hypothetical protein [Pyrinomonadaceae bacterium]